MRKLTAIFFATTLTFAGGVSADPTVEQAKEFYAAGGDERAVLITYLAAFENGLSWANIIQEAKGGKALYCPPGNFVLNGENVYRVAIKQSGQSKTPLEDELITVNAVMGLMVAFPCD